MERGETVARREREVFEKGKEKEKKRHQGGSGVRPTTNGPLSTRDNSTTLGGSDNPRPSRGVLFVADPTDRAMLGARQEVFQVWSTGPQGFGVLQGRASSPGRSDDPGCPEAAPEGCTNPTWRTTRCTTATTEWEDFCHSSGGGVGR